MPRRYDPNPNETVIEEDADLLESYLLVPEADFHPELQSPWLLRLELDKMMMLDKRLECAEVRLLCHRCSVCACVRV